MKSVLISIRPQWCEQIASGKKTIEVRKSAPKEVPFKAYIYCSKGNANEIVLLKDYKNRFSFGDYRNADDKFYRVANGKVIGEFICDKIHKFDTDYSPGLQYCFNNNTDDFLKKSCLSAYDILTYLSRDKGDKEYSVGYGWYITNLKIYDKPKEVSEFCCHDNTYDNAFGWAFEDRAKSAPLTRPPQSWQYLY